MVGASMRLLSQVETDRIFDGDPEYMKIKRQKGVSPYCLEVKYQSTGSASKTEIGTAASNEFKGGAFEKTSVVCDTRANTPGSSYFTFYVSNSSGTITTYYAYFTKKEVFTVVCDTRVNIDGGTYFTYSDMVPTDNYVWFSKYHVQTVVCLDPASITTGTYFTITDSEGAPTSYYVWMDKNGDGATDDPSPAGGATGVAVNISAAASADDVGTALAAALDALAGFGAANSSGTVTITHATKGSPSVDAADVDTGFTISVTEIGGTDPAIGGATGIEADIKGATTADDVGTIVAAAIDGTAGAGAANSSGTVTVTLAAKGNPTNATDVDSGLTVTVTEAGGADPSATGTGVECDISGATTADDVGTIVAAAIDALSDVGAANASGTVTITNVELFAVTATTDGNTGYTITQLEDSADIYSGTSLFFSSSSANDSVANGHGITLQILAFYKDADGIPKLKTEEVTMTGATQGETTETKWFRLIHSKLVNWGSGDDDAAGNIDVENVDSTEFLRIAAGENESEGGVIWLPNHWHAKVAEMVLAANTNAITNAGDGVVCTIEQYGCDETKLNRANTDPDNPNIAVIAISRETPVNRISWPHKSEIHGTDVGKLTIKETLVNTTFAFDLTVYVVLWYKHNTEQD